MNRYEQSKERVRNMAQEWQLDFCNHNYSCSELAFYGDLFTRLGKKYGLIKEFKANGIL